MSRRLAALALALVAAAAAAQTAPGPAPNLERQRLGEPDGPPLAGARLEQLTEEVAGLMRCPVCQGLSVADSPTPLAAAMKNEVRELLAAGYSPQQVLVYFERSYGEFIRLAPRAEGFNLTVWLAPAALLLAGLLLIWRRRQTPAAARAAPTTAPELDPYLERVRREVGR